MGRTLGCLWPLIVVGCGGSQGASPTPVETSTSDAAAETPGFEAGVSTMDASVETPELDAALAKKVVEILIAGIGARAMANPPRKATGRASRKAKGRDA